MINIKSLRMTIVYGLILALAACTGGVTTPADSDSAAQSGSSADTAASSSDIQLDAITADVDVTDYDDADLAVIESTAADTTVELLGNQAAILGLGASTEGSNVLISAAGTYSLSGTLADGQVIVDTQDEDPVVLIFNGVEITSLVSAPVYVRSANKVVITLADGTTNQISDGTDYTFDQGEEPNAAIFSTADLTINGSGALTVNANFNNGIASKDDLRIVSGTITVSSVNDGLKGRDAVAIKDGTILINAGGDGIQANNDADARKGNIFIDGGNIQITTDKDGIQAENTLVVNSGDLVITTRGSSAKGLKAGSSITVNGGFLDIDSVDDTLNTNGMIEITGGEFNLASGDDGIHADVSLVISGGTLNITQSYEGIESANIQIIDGSITLVSSDDGINGGAGNGGRQQPGGVTAISSEPALRISGGSIYLDTGGDGIDINDPIEMTGGIVIINGPTDNMNGSLDYTGYFNVSGGFLVAVGSAGMAEAPSQSSTQLSVLYAFDSMLPAGTLVHIESQSGKDILTFSPAKAFQTVVVSSSQLVNGETYSISTGGEVSGTQVNGLLAEGDYTGGSPVGTFTLTGMVTTIGAFTGGPGGPGGKP